MIHDGYATIGFGLRRRASSLTDVRRPVARKKTMSMAEDGSAPNDKMPVYAVVNKSMRGKKDKSAETATAGSDDRSHPYSKVDEAKKTEAEDQPTGSDGLSTEHDISHSTAEDGTSQVASDEVGSTVVDTGYESIDYGRQSSKVTEGGYDTVGDDFGYDSVDAVAETVAKATVAKDRLPSLATLKRAPEHIYEVVPENQCSTGDYDDIDEIPSMLSSHDATQ